MKLAPSKILRLVVGVAMLTWLVVWVDWRQFTDAVLRCDPWWAAAGLSLFAIATIPAAFRLQVLFRRSPVSFSSALRLTLGSYFFNQLLPTGFGGDVYRTVQLKERNGGWISTVGLVLLERTIGALALIAPAFALVIVEDGGDRVIHELRVHPIASRVAMYAIVAAGVIALVGLSFTGVRRRIRNLFRELIFTIRQLSFGRLTGVAALSILFHALRILGMRAFLEAVGAAIAIDELIIVLALTLLASLVPVTIGALGVREGVLVYALGAYGVPAAEALTVALLARLVVVVLGAVGGVALYRRAPVDEPRPDV